MYGNILPKVSATRSHLCLSELGVPKCYYVDKATGTLIMENLKDKGFRTKPSEKSGSVLIRLT